AVNRQGDLLRCVTPGRELHGRFDLSPDGRTIAYAELVDEKVAFFTVSVQGGEPRLLASSDSGSGHTPRWSPDGERLAYAHDDGLYVVRASGDQTPTRIAQLAKWEPWSVRWSPDGQHVAAFGFGESEKENSIFVVPASGGEPRRLTPLDGIYKEGLAWHPDGERIMYHLSKSHSETYQAFLDGRPPSLFLDHPDSWDYIGEWTADGRRFYFSGSAGGEWKVFVYDAESGDVRLFREHSSLPVWSRDGKTMAWSSDITTRQLWVMEDFIPKPKVAAASGPMTRQVWAPALDSMGMISPNGRYISYVNWSRGNLAVHDCRTGENRDLTDEGTWEEPAKFCDVSIWSPDSRQVAYCWLDIGNGASLRIVGLDGGQPRVVHCDPESGYVWPRAWSHDGSQILAIYCNKGAAGESAHIDKVVLASVADGSIRVLKNQGDRRCRNMDFSPDDRYVIFDLETDVGSGTYDIHLIDTVEDEETVLVEHPANDTAPYWTPGGQRIVFLSDRSGSDALWMLDVPEGKPQGTPRPIKEFGSLQKSMGLTSAGALHYIFDASTLDIHAATLDFAAGALRDAPTKVSLRYEGSNFAPSWSPDGKYLVYASGRTEDGERGYDLVIRSDATGEEKDISPEDLTMIGAHAFWVPRWSPDGRSILVTAGSPRQFDLCLVDVETGGYSTIVRNWGEPGDSRPREPSFSADGKSIYYIRGDHSIVALDVKTREETVLYETDDYVYMLAGSPDNQQIVFLETPDAVRPKVVKVMPAAGGTSRVLYVLEEGVRLAPNVGVSWTPDGRHVVVGGPEGPDKPDELWFIPVSGEGEISKVNLGVKVTNVALHPDGQRISITIGDAKAEIWALENFLPEPETTP
ncbi:MAG: PD40 domain-containing protein, partial [Phycisphaerales bacterium]